MMETKRALRLAQAAGRAAYIRDGYLYTWSNTGFLRVAVAEGDIPAKKTKSLVTMAQAGLPLEMAEDEPQPAPEKIPGIEGERGDVDCAAVTHIVKHAAVAGANCLNDILHYLWADGENIACSDSHRLHIYRCPMPKCNFAYNQALAAIRPHAVTVGENFAVFEGGDATLWLNVSHAETPDWPELVQNELATLWLRLDVKRAQATLTRAKVLAQKDHPELVHIRNGNIVVGAWSEPLGEVVEPKEEAVTLNVFYLADALNGCDTNTATVSWAGPQLPVIVNSGAWRAAVMPVLFSQYDD